MVLSPRPLEKQMNPEDPPTEPQPTAPRRLLRSRNDRVIAGVAGGLGKYFSIDPVIVRIAFAISVLFGGLGAVAYIALALFVPTAPGEDGEIGSAPIERSKALAIGVGVGIVVVALSWGIFDGPLWGHGWFLSPALAITALVIASVLIARRSGGGLRTGNPIVTVLIAFAAFIGLSIAAVGAAWAGATGHGVVVAAVIVAIGVLLIAAAFNGGARWLIAPAIALAVPLGAVAAADISFGDGIGQRTYSPLTVASLPASGYELGVGEMTVDLRDLDWTPDTVVDLNVDLGIGQAVVAVPSDVCVTTDFDTRAGDLQVAGDDAGGVDVHSQANAGATATPRLQLTGEVDLGELRVVNLDDLQLGGHGYLHQIHSRNDEMRTAMTAACATPPAQPTAPAGGNQHPAHPAGGGESRK
jgi:phage shock protein PspC (stress-responsive transcriptional regulator)